MNVEIPVQTREAGFRPKTISQDTRTVDLVWSTGAQVRRADWWTGQRYIEQLSMDPKHIRMERLNGGGANLLNSHGTWSLERVLGVVESAKVSNGEGLATVRFSSRADVAPIWQDVVDGIVRNVSVGYIVHEFERIPSKEDLDTLLAIDWEPVEVSLVSVPADPGAGVRNTPSLSVCQIRNAEQIPPSPEPPVEAPSSFSQRNARALALLERKIRRYQA